MQHFSRLLGVASGLLLLIAWNIHGQPAAQEAGVEVQARGPIHEAFAQPAEPTQDAGPVVPKKPPDPVNELPPEQKPAGNHVQWIPGYWAWDDDRNDFLWVSGTWRAPPPDRHWVPGYWQQAQGGWRWVSGYWALPAETRVELVPPPPQPIEEAIPPQPQVDTVYVPGVWTYRESRFWWRPGHWIVASPGWVWVPAHYCWTPGGYVFVGGFWDHDLHTRGLAFAPAFFDARFYQRPDWFYRPRYALGADFLLGSLFVHLGTNRYYFGDYYDAGYRRRGYAPWVDYRVRGDVFDPLLSYYRWQNRGDVRWEKDLRATYVARRDNKAARPPQTLAQQDGAKSPDAVRVVTPIDKVKTKDIKLEPVPKADIEQIRKNADDWRNFSKQRSKVESNIKPAPPPKKDAAPPPVMIDLPKPTIKPPEMKKPPPPPDVPKVQQPKGPPPDKKKGKGKDKDNDVSFGGGRIPILPISTARLESCRHENTRILVQWKGAYRYGNGQEKLSGASAG